MSSQPLSQKNFSFLLLYSRGALRFSGLVLGRRPSALFALGGEKLRQIRGCGWCRTWLTRPGRQAIQLKQ